MVIYMRKGLGKNNYRKIVKIQGKAWENNGKAEKKPLLELSLRELKRVVHILGHITRYVINN